MASSSNVRTFNSVGGFSIGEVPYTVIDANANITTTGPANVGSLLTDHLLYANGAPWDLQEAAGDDGYIQFNTGDNFDATGNLTFDKTGSVLKVTGNANVTNTLTVPNIITASNANLVIEPNGTGIVIIANTAGGSQGIAVGDPSLGNLVSNAVTMSNSTTVTNGIAQLNEVLGKLVPPAPPAFPASTTIAIQSLSTYRMANFTQTDNTLTGGYNVAGGTTVNSIRRASSYQTNTVTNAGPGNTGNVTVYKNGVDSGHRQLTNSLNGVGTYNDLHISTNQDYHAVNANIQANFWSVFSSYAQGTVTEGWNEVYIADDAASNTNIAYWYYDASSPGTPAFSSTAITAPNSPTYVYTSTVPHYDSSNQFTVSFNVNKLSGDTYPTSDTFVTGTAGGAFAAPASVTYAQASVTTPLSRNLFVSSGSQAVSTTANIITGFGSSTGSPSVTVNNGYNTATQAFAPGVTILYKTGTSNSMEEGNVTIGSTIGSGSGLAARIINPGSTDTPVYTGSESNFNSQSSTLQTYDATIVAGALKHDQTNYSTGYLPAGPNLSSGRSGAQYFTFKFVRTSVSKFDIKWSGSIAGLWVALPGSDFDAVSPTSSLNGWLDASVAYAGAGKPGVNTSNGGNGSNGCALGGVAPLNSVQTNKSVTVTFGTVSSSSTVSNEIYVRIKLTSGQTVTALSLQTASH